ncbi:MAG: glycosyltransferase, partial [Anaerolineae bacterium]
MQTIAIILPTYNERENLEPLVLDILALGLPARIVVVDDNSPD